MPQEQEMPAPVTTTIFLLFATASEILYSVLLECMSEAEALSEIVSSILEDDEEADAVEGDGDEALVREDERDIVVDDEDGSTASHSEVIQAPCELPTRWFKTTAQHEVM